MLTILHKCIIRISGGSTATFTNCLFDNNATARNLLHLDGGSQVISINTIVRNTKGYLSNKYSLISLDSRLFNLQIISSSRLEFNRGFDSLIEIKTNQMLLYNTQFLNSEFNTYALALNNLLNLAISYSMWNNYNVSLRVLYLSAPVNDLYLDSLRINHIIYGSEGATDCRSNSNTLH